MRFGVLLDGHKRFLSCQNLVWQGIYISIIRAKEATQTFVYSFKVFDSKTVAIRAEFGQNPFV